MSHSVDDEWNAISATLIDLNFSIRLDCFFLRRFYFNQTTKQKQKSIFFSIKFSKRKKIKNLFKNRREIKKRFNAFIDNNCYYVVIRWLSTKSISHFKFAKFYEFSITIWLTWCLITAHDINDTIMYTDGVLSLKRDTEHPIHNLHSILLPNKR